MVIKYVRKTNNVHNKTPLPTPKVTQRMPTPAPIPINSTPTPTPRPIKRIPTPHLGPTPINMMSLKRAKRQKKTDH